MTETTTGIPGKGGYTQTVQPMFSENPSSNYSDIDTGSGYYRNPYASGYGMGYQDPYGSARFMPAMGLMGPSSYSPYRGGKGGYASQPMYAPYGYSPYGGLSPAKGGYSPTTDPAPVDDPAVETGVQTSPDAPVEAMAGAESVDPAQVYESAVDSAIAADGSNIVDFTPYTGDEFVRIGDQVVSRADLQRRGSDYYTRPSYDPMAVQYRNQMFPVSVPGKGGYYR